jgi:nitrogen regulatory protein PII
MKLIIAMIKPESLDFVIEQLQEKDIRRLTVFEVKGFGQQMGHKEVYRGTEYEVKLRQKVQLEIAVNDDFVKPTIEAITAGARSAPDGAIGDGKILVLPIEEAVKIRTGETGSSAI